VPSHPSSILSIAFTSRRPLENGVIYGLPTLLHCLRTRGLKVGLLARHVSLEEADISIAPGQDLYFHINHPIKWVRIAGIVVAVDDFGPWRAYTVDDSSGATIECHVNLPKPIGSANPERGNIAQAGQPNLSKYQQQQVGLIGADVKVGDIIDVKGVIRVYRQTRQIKAEKIVHLRSTEQEVQFWERVNALRKEVLDQPWFLDQKVVRKCRKEAEGYDAQRARREKRERRKRRESEEKERSLRDAGTAEEASAPRKSDEPVEVPMAKRPKTRSSGLEKKPKPQKVVVVPITGKYNALGL